MSYQSLFKTPEQTENAFYSAFEQCDLQAMMSVWDETENVTCIHPSGPRLTGRKQIAESWRSILGGPQRLSFSVVIERVFPSDKLVAHTVNEFIQLESQTSEAVILATNIYRLSERGWRLVLHHASPNPTLVGGSSSVQ